MENSIDEILNQNEQESSDINAKLRWFRKRCVIELLDSNNGGELKITDGNNSLNAFLTEKGYLDDSKSYTDKMKADYKDNLEEIFYEYLESKIDKEAENLRNDFWKKRPKELIKQLNQYRNMGVIDKNLGSQLMDYAKKINNDPLRYIYELIQNADDCTYEDNIEKKMTIDIYDDRLVVSYPEIGMSYSDIIAITTIGQSNKRKKKKERIIGEKGRGFKTIFSVCDRAEIYSGPYYFELKQENFAAEWIEKKEAGLSETNSGTELRLYLKSTSETNNSNENNLFKTGENLFKKIKERYGFENIDKENILKNCPIIFLNKLDVIEIKYNNSSVTMKRTKKIEKEDEENNFRNGTLVIEYYINENSTDTNMKDNKPTQGILECYIYEKDVQFTYDEYISHYKKIFKSQNEYDELITKEDNEAITYPVILIAPKVAESDVLRKWKGNMFTYLPTFTNINAPISIQIPFELNEDRSSMWTSEQKGETHLPDDLEGNTTKWNHRLFKEVFIDQEGNDSLIKYAYSKLLKKLEINNGNIKIYDYFPQYLENDYRFFEQPDTKYSECINQINLYSGKGKDNRIFNTFQNLKVLKKISGNEWCSASEEPIAFDTFVDSILENENDIRWINEYLVYTTNQNSEEKSSPCLVKSFDFDTYKNMSVLGIKKAEVKNNVDFTNKLIEIDYSKVVIELAKEIHSTYIPKSEERKNVKAIKCGKENKAPSDFELWIEIISDNENKCDNEFLGFFNNHTGVKYDSTKEILIENIYKDTSFPNKIKFDCNNGYKDSWYKVWDYIYSKKGIKEEIQCSFGLYKELMKYFCKDPNEDWFKYSKKCLESKDEQFIPADNIRIIWVNKYKDYRVEGENTSGKQL